MPEGVVSSSIAYVYGSHWGPNVPNITFLLSTARTQVNPNQKEAKTRQRRNISSPKCPSSPMIQHLFLNLQSEHFQPEIPIISNDSTFLWNLQSEHFQPEIPIISDDSTFILNLVFALKTYQLSHIPLNPFFQTVWMYVSPDTMLRRTANVNLMWYVLPSLSVKRWDLDLGGSGSGMSMSARPSDTMLRLSTRTSGSTPSIHAHQTKTELNSLTKGKRMHLHAFYIMNRWFQAWMAHLCLHAYTCI
jgi:hypothetical protein